MADENARFLFTFSAEGTKQLQGGNVKLSSGGLRNPNGSVFEMAKPILFNPNELTSQTVLAGDDFLQRQLAIANSNLDQILENSEALHQIVWMDYAISCHTYEMTYQGFQMVISRLDSISSQLANIKEHFDRTGFYDHLELSNKYKNKLKSIAGFMETKKFIPSGAFFNVAETLDEIEAYFDRLCAELNNRSLDDQIILCSIIILLEPYCYVLRRFSMLYFYETECFPSNYDAWTGVVKRIMENAQLKRRLQYFLRVKSDYTMEDIYIARDKVLFNLRGFVEQLDFDYQYALRHTKDQYLSIDKQLDEKISLKEYKIIDGHLCIELI